MMPTRTKPSCAGCVILARALPGHTERWHLLSAMRQHAFHREAELTPGDAVFVVGEPSLLPEDLRGRGDHTLLVSSRADLHGRYAGTVFGNLLSQLARPAPPGQAWVVAAFPADPSTGEAAGIAVYLHLVPATPTASAARVVALALVPPDGGDAPGARITAPGGTA